MEQPEKPRRGGARPGAGRKAKRGETEVMRVPSAYKKAILALIEHLDATQQINRHYRPVESAPVFMRSLQGKAQHLSFKTTPVVPQEHQEELNL